MVEILLFILKVLMIFALLLTALAMLAMCRLIDIYYMQRRKEKEQKVDVENGGKENG